MPAKFIPQALTANRLTDGEAVWWSVAQRWSDSLADADVAREATDAARLEAIGKAEHAANVVVDVDLIDVEAVDGKIVPLRLRERIRAAGPTNRTDLGKQARLAAVRAA